MKLDITRFKNLKKRKGYQEERRITNKVIEAETGIKVSSLDDYARIENGVQNPISIKSLVILSRYFHVDPCYLAIEDDFAEKVVERIAELEEELLMLKSTLKLPAFVDISKDKFKKAMANAGYSEKRFGLFLQKEGVTTYRSLQRNLQYGRMKRSVLRYCAEHLGCSPEDLLAKENEEYE